MPPVRMMQRAGRRRLRADPTAPVLPRRAWFDAPDAASQIVSRAVTPADRAMLESWVNHGYAIAEQVVPHDLIDDMLSDLDSLFVDDGTPTELVFHDVVTDDGRKAAVPHAALLELDPDQRAVMRDRSNWRVHAFHEVAGPQGRCQEALRADLDGGGSAEIADELQPATTTADREDGEGDRSLGIGCDNLDRAGRDMGEDAAWRHAGEQRSQLLAADYGVAQKRRDGGRPRMFE